MDQLREQLMINQFALVAGCNHDHAKRLLQLNNWSFQKALSVFLQEAASTSNTSTINPYHTQFNPVLPANSPFNFPETLLAFLKLSQATEAHHQQSLLSNPNHGLNIPSVASDSRFNHLQQLASQQLQQCHLASSLYENTMKKCDASSSSSSTQHQFSSKSSTIPRPATFSATSKSSNSKTNSQHSVNRTPGKRRHEEISSANSGDNSKRTAKKPVKHSSMTQSVSSNSSHKIPMVGSVQQEAHQQKQKKHHQKPHSLAHPHESQSSSHFNPIPFDVPVHPSHRNSIIKSDEKSDDKHSQASKNVSSNSLADGDMPLNLCVKKVDTIEGTKRNSSKDSRGCYSNQELNIGDMMGNNCNLSGHYDPSFDDRPRKRCPKSKSILANQAEPLPVILVPEPSEIRPKKRGRPPILSPPLGLEDHRLSENTRPAHSNNLSNDSRVQSSIIPQNKLNLMPSHSIHSDPRDDLPGADDSYRRRVMEGFDANSGISDDNSICEAGDEDSDLDEAAKEGFKSFTGDLDYNLDDLRKPLKFGWRRQTLIKCITKFGVEGEVIYYSPCSRKLKNYSDVCRYLLKKNISIIKKENFCFDPRPIIGEYIEHGKGLDFLILSETEVLARLEEIRKSPSQNNLFGISDDNENLSECERRELLKNNSKYMGNSAYVNRHNDDPRARVSTDDTDGSHDETNRKFHDNKDIRRYQAEIFREADLYKKRDLQMIAEVDRERRKQHMILIRALDAHKRYEERERERERISNEKRALLERKYKKRRIELEIIREIRRPIEDMLLKRSTPLPKLNRIPGLKLSTHVFAQLLMVYEFLHNFGGTLGFDMDSLPTLNTLQKALLNLEESAEDELISVLHHLLVCAIDDPGTPCHVTTVMGQKLRDAPITNFDLSEILKLYFYSFASQYPESPDENRIPFEIHGVLSTGRPFLSLSPAQKSEVLTFLCNELSGNQAIIRHIEETIEVVGNLRKERWHLGCELRKYKAIKLRREKSSEEAGEELKKFDKNEIDGGLLEDSGESDVDDNIIITVNETEEDASITTEELDKRLNKLAKECAQINNKLNKAIQCLRVSPLGQDRYRRRYWFLPAAGGIFVEGLESGQPEELENNAPKEDDESSLSENESDDASSVQDSQTVSLKKIEKSESSKDGISIEPVCMERDRKPTKEVTVTIQPIVSQDDMTPVKKEEIKCDMEIEINPTSVPPSSKEVWASTKGQQNDLKDNNLKNHALNFNGISSSASMFEPHANNSKSHLRKPWFSIIPRTPCNDTTILVIEKKQPRPPPTPSSSSAADAKTDSEVLATPTTITEGDNLDDNTDKVTDVKSNNLVNALLYPHLLESFYHQIRPNGEICPSESSCEQQKSSTYPPQSEEESDANQSRPQAQNETSTNDTKDICSKLEAEIISFNCECPDLSIERELEKKLIDRRKIRYRTPKRIPQEYQRGWWWIINSDDVGLLVSTLNENGIRERQLLKHLNKYVNYVSSRCKSSIAKFDVNSDEENCDDDSQLPCDEDLSDNWNKHVALRLDISVLEQIEAFEEKVSSSSMQIRGWRPLAKLTTDSSIKFELSPSYLSSSSSENVAPEKSTSKSKSEANKKIVDPLKIGRERVLTAEAMIERRYLKPPLGFKANTIIVSNSGGGSDEFSDNAADENAPSGLLRWRDAVRECENGSQLALLLHFLESCIAWDKSIMRASCQFCGSGENEAQLLLCDGCDKGYHMYCFKPKMETVPDGDWFCFECQNKNTIDKVCIVCGKKGKLINCDTCPKVFHPNCLDPPVTKPPKGRWCCNMCNRKPKKKVSRKSGNTQSTSNDDKETPPASINPPKEPEKKTKSTSRQKKEKDKEKDKEKEKEKESAHVDEPPTKETRKEKKSKEKENKEMSICGILLSDLEKQDDSWPFLNPVNTKQFPTYKKIIKKPIDFVTIKNRLESGGYKNKTEFMADCRLIFDNCETFNEDESPVGQAGHNLRRFMEKRWKELGGEKPDKS